MRRHTLLALLLVGALLIATVSCRAMRRSNSGDDLDNSADSNLDNVDEGDPVPTGPTDSEVVEQAAGDLHVKVKSALDGGTLDLPEGKAATLELTYSKDEIEVSFENYAAYLGNQMLERMVRYADAPYTVVAGSDDRQELLKAQAERLDDAYNEDALTGMGDMLAGNIALFVVVRGAPDEQGELLSIKLFVAHTGAMLYANEYVFASGYQSNLEKAEAAELAGDTDEAIRYYEAADSARRGHDPRVGLRLAALRALRNGNIEPIVEYDRKLSELEDDCEALREDWDARKGTANVFQLRGMHDRLVAVKDRILALIRFKRVQAAVDLLKEVEQAIDACKREIKRRT